MAAEIAIRVENVSKNFKLPHERHNSLKSKIVHAFGKTKGFQTQHALKDVSFEIKKGEFFGIVGRNGSGKSTMLKMLAGIYQPTAGKISVSGKLVPFIELGVGFNPELTGRENVFLNGALLGFTNKQVAKMYDDIVEFAELEKFMDQKLKNYSSGMQVRLAFSMAVRADADVLLIDEVLAVGDESFQQKCFDYFKKLKKNEKTVVFVSHNMAAVKDYCDRVLLVDKSEVVMTGPASKVCDEYSKLFLKKSTEFDLDQKSWGTGDIKIERAAINKKKFDGPKEKIVITVDLKSYSKVEKDYFTGFRVVNQSGQILHETHTKNENLKLQALPPKAEKRISWEYPNVYVNGKYVVDVYVYSDGNQVYDMQKEVLGFTVKRKKTNGFFLVQPDIKINQG